jgi:hypothetical protein
MVINVVDKNIRSVVHEYFIFVPSSFIFRVFERKTLEAEIQNRIGRKVSTFGRISDIRRKPQINLAEKFSDIFELGECDVTANPFPVPKTLEALWLCYL